MTVKTNATIARMLCVLTILFCTPLIGTFHRSAAADEICCRPRIARGLRRLLARRPAERQHEVVVSNTPIDPWTKLFTGQSLGKWRVIEQDTYEDHGKVAVKDGAIVLEKGGPATGVVWTGTMPRIDYELQLQARRDDGSDFFCGLTFPIGADYCTLILGGWGGGTTGLSNVDSYPAIENEASGYYEFENGHWYQIRLRVSKDSIVAWVEDKKILDLDTKEREFSIWWEQEPARPLGIGTWYTAASLRNIRVRKLSAEDLQPAEPEK